MNDSLQQYIIETIGSSIKCNVTNKNNELQIAIEKDSLCDVLRFLRDDPYCLFVMLISICAVDYVEREKRFEVVYNLLSLKMSNRIRVKLSISDKESVPTVTELFRAAGWYEREVFDMFGIKFSGNEDLRRILTDYNFKGHPLRKDFPLTGYEEVRYDLEKRKVVYEDVKLDQEFRDFDFLSPWEGMEKNLPGDEKAGTEIEKEQAEEDLKDA